MRAKKQTYAGKGAEAASSRPNSHDLHYAEGPLRYIDTYVGEAQFAGEEAIWKEDTPIWAMNYAGRVTGDNFSGDFLKEVLFNVPEEYPFRGPPRYHNGDYVYTCAVTGNVHWFSGFEEIFYQDNKIYECIFHGGEIK